MTDGPLSGWMRTLINYVRSGQPDLTNRQMALLLVIYLTPGPHTVRGIAATLGVSKPVVTRALNTLGSLGYLRRERDQDDRRNVFVNTRAHRRKQRQRQQRPRAGACIRRSLTAASRWPGRPNCPTPSPTPIVKIWPMSPSPVVWSPRIMPNRC